MTDTWKYSRGDLVEQSDEYATTILSGGTEVHTSQDKFVVLRRLRDTDSDERLYQIKDNRTRKKFLTTCIEQEKYEKVGTVEL